MESSKYGLIEGKIIHGEGEGLLGEEFSNL